MCFSLGGSNNAAAQAQAAATQQTALLDQQTAKRNSDISEGKTRIDDAFKQFDDPSYGDNYKKAYISNYEPQLDQQYGIAKDKLIATLAGRGTLDSTVGANQIAQTQKTYNDAQGNIANSAADAVNGLRTSIDSTKSNLYGMNASAADPSAAGVQAQAAAGSVMAPSAYPQLGNVFAAALQPFAAAQRSDATSLTPRLPWNTLATGTGSARYS